VKEFKAEEKSVDQKHQRHGWSDDDSFSSLPKNVTRDPSEMEVSKNEELPSL
jgi:hypothetical protein